MTEWPRVGKLRIGEKVAATSKAGAAIERPSAIDYFRGDPEDGITSPESAASFHEVYGERPKVIRCQLPGRVPEDVFEGAWRLYGARKLKIRCDGETCDERTATGGWEAKPCVCKARALAPTHKDHCKLTWTLNVLLPDVLGVGVWQIDTGSEISIARISRWLQMMASVGGDLMLLDFTLNLVPVDVTPDGRTKQVHVLEPRAVASSPRELLTGGGRAPLPQLEAGAMSPVLPAPADDEPPLTEGEVVLPVWEEVLDQLRDIAPWLTDVEIVQEASDAMGRTVNATELDDPEVSGRVTAYLLDLRAAKEAEDWPLPTPGQTSFLGDDGDPGPEPPYGDPE